MEAEQAALAGLEESSPTRHSTIRGRRSASELLQEQGERRQRLENPGGDWLSQQEALEALGESA
jgi:hypothetical protein